MFPVGFCEWFRTLPLTNMCGSFSLKHYRFAWTALQGFNATLTEPVDALGRAGQIRELEPKLHPNLKGPLKKLSDDPQTTIVLISGSNRAVLDKVLSRKVHVFLSFSATFAFGLTTTLCRTSVNLICGWQRKMGCFCDSLQVSGWQPCLKI